MLDHALALEPENVKIRYLRSQVCRKLPEMYFHRTGTLIEDLSYLAHAMKMVTAPLAQSSTGKSSLTWVRILKLWNMSKMLIQHGISFYPLLQTAATGIW